MGQLGIGAILHQLGGGSEHDAKEYIGRKIVDAYIADNRLAIEFNDGTAIKIWDNGQSCCEDRYMRTDDDPRTLVGHTLQRIEAKAGPDEPNEWGGDHEIVFVEVGTDAGFITVANHNEHSGYYGGFGLTITESPAE